LLCKFDPIFELLYFHYDSYVSYFCFGLGCWCRSAKSDVLTVKKKPRHGYC
jgi:hypothetical protein